MKILSGRRYYLIGSGNNIQLGPGQGWRCKTPLGKWLHPFHPFASHLSFILIYWTNDNHRKNLISNNGFWMVFKYLPCWIKMIRVQFSIINFPHGELVKTMFNLPLMIYSNFSYKGPRPYHSKLHSSILTNKRNSVSHQTPIKHFAKKFSAKHFVWTFFLYTVVNIHIYI